MLILGDREVEARTASVRRRDGSAGAPGRRVGRPRGAPRGGGRLPRRAEAGLVASSGGEPRPPARVLRARRRRAHGDLKARRGRGISERDLRVNQMIRSARCGSSTKRVRSSASCRRAMPFDWRRSAATTSSRLRRWRRHRSTRLLDYGQYKYELTKREKEAKRKSALGRVQGGPPQAEDRRGRLRHEGPTRDRVPGGRRPDQGGRPVPRPGADPPAPRAGLLAKFADQIKDHGVVERAPLLEGKSMHITIASTHKPKPREATGGAPAPDDASEPDEAEGAARGAPEGAAPAVAVDAAGPSPAAPAGE